MSRYRRALLALAVFALAIVPAVAFAAAPSNDNFANPDVLDPSFGQVTGDNTEATDEQAAGEPDHASSGFGPAHSVWYRWHPAADSSNTFDTCGSSFDTRIAIYVGTGLGSLSQIAANNDSAGTGCSGTKASEVTSFFSAGTDYYIAVDTMGPLPTCDSTKTRGPFRLRLNGSGTSTQMDCPGTTTTPPTDPPATEQPPAEQPPTEQPPADDGKTTPGTPVAPRTATFTVPQMKPQGTKFFTLSKLNQFLSSLRDQGLVVTTEANPTKSKEFPTEEQRNYLRTKGGEGELLRGRVILLNNDGSDRELDPGAHSAVTTESKVLVQFSYFDLGTDLQAIAQEKADLKREADRLARKAKEAEREALARIATSRCLPIASGMKSDEILKTYFPNAANATYSLTNAIEILSALGCDVATDGKPVAGKPSAQYPYVKDVVGYDVKLHTITVKMAQPGSHDFIFTIREEPEDFDVRGNNPQIPIGTDGRLTVSNLQDSRITVQVIERASGNLVSGIEVSISGGGDFQTKRTDANGETWFAVPATPRYTEQVSDQYWLSASFQGMEGFRILKAEDRGKEFTSMAGRTIAIRHDRYKGIHGYELERAKALPVVPANLGTGYVGAVQSIPVIRQAAITKVTPAGQVTGSYNAIELPNNSQVLVGAGQGLIAAAGGDGRQAGRPVAARRAGGIGNPLDFLGSIVTPMTNAIAQGAANIRAALSALEQQRIALTAQLIGQAGYNLISDKGLGVISVGGGNVISVGGANVISVGGGNLIGQAGGNFISTNTGNFTPVHGGRVISVGGGN